MKLDTALSRALSALTALVFGILFAPLVVMVAFSFDDSPIPSWPIRGPTTRWYGELFEWPDLYIDPLFNTIYVAGLTSVLATAIGTLAAVAISRYDFPGKSVFPFFLATPAMVPPLLSGFGLLGFFTETLGVSPSLYTVVVGHTALTIPFAAFIVASKLGPERELERAARDLGAGRLRTVWEVTLPMIAPAIVASILITFTISFGETSISLLLSGRDTTFPTAFQQILGEGISPAFNAISTVALCITFGLFALAEAIRQTVGR